MTHPERLERTIASLRKAITTGDFSPDEIRDIEYAIKRLQVELDGYNHD